MDILKKNSGSLLKSYRLDKCVQTSKVKYLRSIGCATKVSKKYQIHARYQKSMGDSPYYKASYTMSYRVG